MVPEGALPSEPLPPHTMTCMGCGPDNPHGLQLVVHRSDDAVYGDVGALGDLLQQGTRDGHDDRPS